MASVQGMGVGRVRRGWAGSPTGPSTALIKSAIIKSGSLAVSGDPRWTSAEASIFDGQNIKQRRSGHLDGGAGAPLWKICHGIFNMGGGGVTGRVRRGNRGEWANSIWIVAVAVLP